MTELTDYPDGETPEVPPTEQPTFDPHENWVNYWDYNPIAHGGKFVRWDGSMWEIVEVITPYDTGDSYHVERYYYEPMDVWENPDDPETGFTDAMKAIIDSLGESHFPNGEGNPFLENVTYYVAGLIHHTGSQWRDDAFEIEEGDTEAYWENLESYGVDPADVEGVSDRDLPDE